MLLPCVSVADVKPLTDAFILADVIAKWQMVKPLQGDCVMADVIASGSWYTTGSFILILVLRC